MKIGIEVDERIFQEILDIVCSIEKEKNLDEILIELLLRKVYTSDILFILLQKLSKEGYIFSHVNKIRKEKNIEEEKKKEILNYLKNKVENIVKNKIFFSSLDISKFSQCSRRFFLEKVVKSQQKKTQSSFEGEVFHRASYLLIKNYNKIPLEQLISQVSERVLNEFKDKVKVEKNTILSSLGFLDEFIRKHKFKFLISEPKIISIKNGLIASPDLIGISENEIIPIDLKMGSLRVKEALKIQLLSEVVVVESFFKKEVNSAMIISLLKRKVFKLKINQEEKQKVYVIKKQIERSLLSNKIFPISNLPNFRKLICPFCHVKDICDEIEKTKRILLKSSQEIS
jgi:CRISPR/Cas system-associated exonuclease Cas4 (RecB family)